ncbi:MAG: MFS transporter [Pseudomonadota bacterium]
MTAQVNDSSSSSSATAVAAAQEAVPKPAYSLPILIWGSAAAFFFFQFIVRTSPSVSANQIMQDLSIQACVLGVVASMYYWGYTLMQIPVGLILDLVGVRYPLTIAIFMCVVGCFLFVGTDSLLVMSIGRLLMGVGSAFAFLSCVKTASVWFDAKHLPIILGWTILIGPLGGVVGSGKPLAALVSDYGWRQSIMMLAFIGLGIAVMAWLLVRDDKRKGTKAEEIGKHELSTFESFLVLLRNPQTYCYALYGTFMYVPISGFADLWGAPYIEQAYSVDKVVAAGSASLVYLGVGIGGPVGAWVISYLQSYKKFLFMGSVLTCAMFSIIIYAPLPAYRLLIDLPGLQLYVLDVMFLLTGIFASTQFFAFACVCLINPKNVRATATGIQNMAAMTTGIVFQPVIGWLLDWVWDGTLLDKAPVYTQNNYYVALSVVPISLLLACFVCLSLREVCSSDDEG